MGSEVVGAIIGAVGAITAAVAGVAMQRRRDPRPGVDEGRVVNELRERLGDRPTIDLAIGPTLRLSEADAARIDSLLEALGSAQTPLDNAASAASDEPDASTLLEYARGLLAKRRWRDAAAALDRYVALAPADWEAQFARGTAHANSRGGTETDLLALRSYNEALALAPRAETRIWISRFYGYRGAMLKRLGRLSEARNDLELALKTAESEQDRHDALYNLAAVHALNGERSPAMKAIRSLVGTSFIAGIAAHEHDYFMSLSEDPEFRALVPLRVAQ